MTNPDTPVREASLAAAADLARGEISAGVMIASTPERVFRALTSQEVCKWWVRPGVFDTRQWSGEPHVGGRWEASGVGNGRPYRLEGEFLEIEAPNKLVHTWQVTGVPGTPTVVTYRLEAIAEGTRLNLTHSGFAMPEPCTNTCLGWETSLQRLAQLLAAERTPRDHGL